MQIVGPKEKYRGVPGGGAVAPVRSPAAAMALALPLTAMLGCSPASSSTDPHAVEPARAEAASRSTLSSTSTAGVRALLEVAEAPPEAAMVSFSGSTTSRLGSAQLIAPSPKPVESAAKPPLAAAEPELPPTPTNTERLLETTAGYQPEKLVRVLFATPEPPFSWHVLGREDLTQEDRSEALEFRRASVAASTQPVREALAAMGATNVESFLSVAAISALVPAGALKELSARADVSGLAGDAQLRAHPELGYGGLEARSGMKVDAFSAAGIDASTGGRAGGRACARRHFRQPRAERVP